MLNPTPIIPKGAALEDAIQALKKSMNAVILAHFYQDDAIQDIADYVGDSLQLAQAAAKTDAEVIVFCGVRFMAEGAKILNPNKLVLLPDMNAGCSLEDSCPPDAFAAFKAAHPEHLVITYINCSARVKALSDIIVTSSNAERIINQLPLEQKIIFAPDRYLGDWLNKKTGRNMLLWNGSCMVHERFSEAELVGLKTRHPQARIIAHPECPAALLAHAEFVGSTSALIAYVEKNPTDEFIVLTEPGIFHAMKRRAPESVLHTVSALSGGACIACNQCPHMRMNTMEKLYACMANRAPALELPADLLLAAKKPLLRMLEMSA